jgi:hypothetical protein
VNRSKFIASAVATTAAIAAMPTAALATPSVSAIPTAVAAAAPTLHLFEIGSGWAWVFAHSEAEALEAARQEYEEGDPVISVTQVADDAPFTMMFDPAYVPDGVELDVACTCKPDHLEKYGCDCAAGDNPVTLTPAQWAALPEWPEFMQAGKVIKEWQG